MRLELRGSVPGEGGTIMLLPDMEYWDPKEKLLVFATLQAATEEWFNKYNINLSEVIWEVIPNAYI